MINKLCLSDTEVIFCSNLFLKEFNEAFIKAIKEGLKYDSK